MSSEPGTVTVENMGLDGVTVQLSGVSSASAVTDDNGQYAFTGLRMGNYAVEISGFDSDEVGFSATASAVTVGVGESKIISFDGTYLRTAGIMGQVSVEGEGVEGVNVSLSGGPDNASETTTTDASGQYSFAKLRAGDYAVGISGYDTDEYEFEVTSRNVTVALGETANVPFEGILLRTAGVSGRVSVEGVGIEDVMVTLSSTDMDDMTAMTDAGGTYAFAGLAAGDYTVAIALSEAQMAAYVFDMTSMDVTLEDDMTSIVNFEAEHAATASVTVQLFVDEGTKNDMHDDNEPGFPTADMLTTVAALGLPLPLDQVVSLAGPGVHDMQPGMVMANGQVVFADLKAGEYQLIITDLSDEVLDALPPQLAVVRDYGYGGPVTGYPLNVGVGEEVKQHVPLDITHTTINVAVTLKGGEHRGMGVPGATVALYADAAGTDMVGSDTTMVNDEGHAYTSIRVARDGTTGHAVYMGISTEDYWVDPTAGMQTVMWNPMSPVHPMPGAMPAAVLNDATILNLNVDVSVNGATITTEAGGGEPLEDWVISIGHGDVMEADTLDEDGMAAFKMELPPAVLPLLPKDFTFSVVHDTIQSNSLDGGEMYESEPFVYTHTGLALAGAVDAALEVKYTTQTLKIWVHQERDQVPGYTKTISGGDSRPVARLKADAPNKGLDTGISVELRYIDENGRSRPVPDYENRTRHPAGSGIVTYSEVPTDLDIVVKAAADLDRKIINNDEAQAWRDFEANRVLGSAFGEHGGFHHTVNLCPESADDPDQDFLNEGALKDVCSTFGYVWTRDISGDAMSRNAEMAENPSQADPFEIKTKYHSGIEVSVAPVDRKNVQADNFGATTSVELSAAGRQLGTYGIANVGDGNYKLSASSGWWDDTNYRGDISYTTDESADDPSEVPPAAEVINIVPRTVDIYGVVTDEDGFEVGGVEVTAAGQTATTDDYGRYILDDVALTASRAQILVTAAKTGYKVQLAGGAARTSTAVRGGYSLRYRDRRSHEPRRLDFVLSEVTPTGTVSGTVQHLQSSDPIEGVRVFALPAGDEAAADLWKPGLVQIDKDAAGDPVKTFGGMDFADVDTTDADGNFSVDAPAGALNGMETTIIAYHSGMFFTPDRYVTPVVNGGEYTVNFQSLRLSAITGRVVDDEGDGMEGIKVTAEGGTSGVEEEGTTTANGRYNIRVPWGPYVVTPDKAGEDEYDYEPASLSVTLAAEQIRTLQNFTTMHDGTAPMVSLALTPASIDEDGGVSTVTASLNRAHTAAVKVTVMAAPKAGDNAAEMDDFTLSDDVELTIAAGMTTSTGEVTITASPDDTDSDNEEVTVSGTVTAGDLDDPADKTLTIMDDDAKGSQVTLVLTPDEIDESGSNNESTVTATLDMAAPRAFEVMVSIPPDEGATMGANNLLYFAAGATSATGSAVGDPVEITAVNDNDYTGDKMITVSGTVTAESLMEAPDAEMLTIKEDDEPTVVTLVLSRPSISEADDTETTDVNENESILTATIDRVHDEVLTITVMTDPAPDDEPFTVSATTLTIPAGSMSSLLDAAGEANGTNASIEIEATADDEDAMNETVMISGAAAPEAGVKQPQPVTLTIVDDDAPAGAIADLDATAPAPSTAATVTITLTWTAPTNTGMLNGEDATIAYESRQKTSGQEWSDDWQSITTSEGSGANAGKLVGEVTGVAVNNTYQYQVRAVITNGPDGPESNTAEVVVAPATSE